MTEQLRIGRREIRLTHPDRVLFGEAGLTKLDVAHHYERVAPRMLPYVRDRPLALQAFPDGIEHDGYFLKAVPSYFPEWIARATVPKKGGTITHVLAQNAATLVYLAGQNVVTLVPTLGQTATGQCATGAVYWDLGIRGDIYDITNA